MGIPYYFYTIYKKYNKQNNLFIDLSDILKTKCDRILLFDYNSLIHPCAKHVMDSASVSCSGSVEQDIIDYTIKYTESIINVIQPTSVGIYIDGVAPLGKIKQQRERRFKSTFTTDDTPNSFDKNNISPGTEFMKKLEKELKVWGKSYSLPVHFSLSTECGEGEHKITKFLRETDNTKAEVYIYGLDADLLMLSLLVHLHNKYDKLYLFRDNSDRESIIVDIKELGELLYRDITTGERRGKHGNVETTGSARVEACTDYIVLCCLFGNDFLPPMKECSLQQYGIESILRGYARVNKGGLGQVTSGKYKLNIPLFSQCCYYIYNAVSRSNPVVMSKDNLVKDISELKVPTDRYLLLTGLDYTIYTKHVFTDTQKYIYYTHYDVKCTEEEISKLCIEYLSTIEWVINYYMGLSSSNYHYKYHVAPLFVDFVHFTNTWKHSVITDQPVEPLYNEIDESRQLSMILPQDTDRILILDTTFSKYFWQTRLLN